MCANGSYCVLCVCVFCGDHSDFLFLKIISLPFCPLPVNTILLSYIFLEISYVSFFLTKNHKGRREEADNTSLPLLKQVNKFFLASNDLQQKGLDDPRLVSNGVTASVHFSVDG